MQRPCVDEWLTDEGLAKIGGWAKDGLVDKQIAHNMGIGVSTYYRWVKAHKELRDTIKKDKDVADRHIENATFKAACGYYYEVETYKPDDSGNLVLVSRQKKYMPPDVSACIFWLCNRKPDVWKRNGQCEINVNTEGVNSPIVLAAVMEKSEE